MAVDHRPDLAAARIRLARAACERELLRDAVARRVAESRFRLALSRDLLDGGLLDAPPLDRDRPAA